MLRVATTTDTSVVLKASLAQAGFTPEQITRLEALRAAYPITEFVTSRAELDRLTFLKWRWQTVLQCSDQYAADISE